MSTALSIISQYVAGDEEFARLPQWQRDRIYRWGYALSDYYSAPGTKKMIRYARIQRTLGCRQTTVITKIKEWERTHDWRIFKDGRDSNNKKYADTGIHCQRFRAWAVTFAELDIRSKKEACRIIKAVFLYGGMKDPIPGYEHHIPGTLPPEINDRALYRIFKAHEKEIARARFGVDTVKNTPVLKDREQVLPGQLYEWDDMLHDCQVMWNGEAVRVNELAVYDYASACRFHFGHIPAFERMSDGKRQSFNRKLALMFVAYVLRYIGYHPDKCILMMEHGTMTLSKEKKLLLETATGGVIEVRMGGIKGQKQQQLGGHAARGKGNPMAKGGIEGNHSLVHNITGHLPLQTGWKNRNEPAMSYGIRKEAETVAFWQAALEAKGEHELALALENPVMKFHEFVSYLKIKYDLMNGRTEHNIKGWNKNTTLEYCIGRDTWIDGSELDQDPAQKALLTALIQSRPDLVRERQLSPLEVWNTAKNKLVRIPLSLYVDLIGDDRDFGRTITVRDDGLIRVRDAYVEAGDELIYLAEIHQDGHPPIPMTRGQQYRVIINPYASHELIVQDQSGRILGMAPKYTTVSPLGEDIYKQIGRTESRKAQDIARQRARWETYNTHVATRQEHNRNLAEEGGVAPRRPRRTLPPAGNLPDSDYTPAEPLHATVTHHDGLDLPDADTTSYGGF